MASANLPSTLKHVRRHAEQPAQASAEVGTRVHTVLEDVRRIGASETRAQGRHRNIALRPTQNRELVDYGRIHHLISLRKAC